MTAARVSSVVADAVAWSRCAGCGLLVYNKKLNRGLGVCAECGYHHRLTAAGRIAQLVDAGTFHPLGVRVSATDVLEFSDTRAYADRLAEARRRTGMDDAVLCGTGHIGGVAVCLAVMDFRFMGGSLGVAVGELITRTAEEALARRAPLLIVTASGGARMQEGVLALMQMAKVSQALCALGEAGVLSISLVTDPTYGGVAASFATNCDIVLVEQGARMGFAGPRVIEQTIRQKLPPTFQTADFLMAHGQVDAVAHRRDLRDWLRRLLLATRAVADRPVPAATDPVMRDSSEVDNIDPWDAAVGARDPGRPTLLDYLRECFDGFVELRGDRFAGDCSAIVAGFAMLDRSPVAVVGHQKGHDTRELVSRNFGMPRPEGYRKALRVMRLAAKLGIPIVSLVDTPGAYPGREAEENGQSAAIAQNILAMFQLATPVVTVVTGEGGSGGALALAVADRVLMAEHATYSVISPEGCSAILWGGAKSAPQAARALRVTARELLDLGVVDGVLPEPAGGAATDPATMAARLRAAVSHAIAELSRSEVGRLLVQRRDRFRAFGANGFLIGSDITPARPGIEEAVV